MMVTVPIKGLLEMLGLFYNNSEGTKKEEESKQPIEPRNSPKLGHIIPILTRAILEINNP